MGEIPAIFWRKRMYLVVSIWIALPTHHRFNKDEFALFERQSLPWNSAVIVFDMPAYSIRLVFVGVQGQVGSK